MNFKFNLNESGSIQLVEKPMSTELAGIESEIETISFSLDMLENDSEFGKAVTEFGIESTIYLYSMEAKDDKSSTDKKQNIFKRTWEYIKKMFKALKNYIITAIKWVKKRFTKNKVDSKVEQSATIASDVYNMCTEIMNNNKDLSGEEQMKIMKSEVDKKYGKLYGPEAIGINTLPAIPGMGVTITEIISNVARRSTIGDNPKDIIRIPVSLPIEDPKIAEPHITKAINIKSSLTLNLKGKTLKDFENHMYALITCVVNGLELVWLTQSTDGVMTKIVDNTNVTERDHEFRRNVKEFEKINPITLHTVRIGVVPLKLNTKEDIINEIKKTPHYTLSKKLYDYLYDTINNCEYFANNSIDEILNSIESRYTEISKDDINPTELKETAVYTQKLTKMFIKALSREKVDKAVSATEPKID
jgi:hypothetical protein